VLLAVVPALASAVGFTGGSALQHRVASGPSASEESRTGFIARLVRRPLWLIGLGLSAVAFGCTRWRSAGVTSRWCSR
jgi:hypothetical protein